ncbi:MAG TPA: hypothetical protein VF153_00305 [Candidatus Limnocylindria bacterium]
MAGASAAGGLDADDAPEAGPAALRVDVGEVPRVADGPPPPRLGAAMRAVP